MGDGDGACYRAIEGTVGDANIDIRRVSHSGQANQLHAFELGQWVKVRDSAGGKLAL